MVTSNRRGFTLIEMLIVVSLIGLLFSVGLPISYHMYAHYRDSLKVEEVLIFVSAIKRESFLYSETQILTSKEGHLLVNGKGKIFDGAFIQVDSPIEFYKNGTTSGGTLKIMLGRQVYAIKVQEPLGELFFERKGTSQVKTL